MCVSQSGEDSLAAEEKHYRIFGVMQANDERKSTPEWKRVSQNLHKNQIL
jgi:hypothetical protein